MIKTTIQVTYNDETAGIYDTMDEAESAIKMNLAGEMMGPHGSPTMPTEISEVDESGKVVKTFCVSLFAVK